MAGFLPINAREMRALGWERPDFVYVLGDAYVDHPSFGHAIISRVLERAGYRVAMLPQPDWRDPSSVLEFGEPRLGFLVTGGNMDSMVNHYSVGRHRRRTDAYTPGGVTGKRPDYATVVYCNLIRRSFPKIPILIGGIEASLRRLAHYDYWSDSLKRSILLDSQADLLLYGMGERAIVEVADAMNSGLDIHDITFVNGTAYRTRDCSGVVDAITLPSYDELRADRRRYAESFAVQYRNTDPFHRAVRLRVRGAEPAAAAAFHAGDGRRLRSAVSGHLSPVLPQGGRCARHRRGAVQPRLEPRLLRRLLVLRADVSSGPHRPDAQP